MAVSGTGLNTMRDDLRKIIRKTRVMPAFNWEYGRGCLNVFLEEGP